MRTLLATTIAGACAVASALAGPAPAAAAEPVAGFRDRPLATFEAITTVEWLPTDELAVLEQRGRLWFVRPDGQATERLRLDVCLGSERGLLGFAADPAFLTNQVVYLYYTRAKPAAPGGCVNRLSRFDLGSGAETVLLDDISSVNGNHNGGALELGGDGYLYVGIGDAGRDPRGRSGPNPAAQDLSLLNGKILRITTAGLPAPGNPLLGEPGVTRCATRGNLPSTPTTPCAEIWAWGLRNPYRIAFDRDAGSSRLYANDVGQGTYEEIDDVRPGNYGWPEREGPCARGTTEPCPADADTIAPVTWYGRNRGTVITGGAFVPDGLWPAAYDGAYLFGDAGSGTVWSLGADGDVDYDAPFATGLGQLSDLTFGFDGDGRAVLYYVTTSGRLGAIAPTATAAVTPDAATVFTATAPYRAFDTHDERSRLVTGTTRLIDTGLPEGATAALVNITLDATAGAGFLRAWVPRGTRPATSTVNAEAAGGIVANAAIVPLDAERRFVVEVSTTTRVVVDVMGAFTPAPGAVSAGRFVPLAPARVADTRQPAGPGNRYTDSGSTTLVDLSRAGFPSGDAIGAYVLSVAAVSQPGTSGGFVGAFPGGGEYSGTSNVNVVAGDVRANLVVVPADATGRVAFEHYQAAGFVVDVLGYFTGPGAETSEAGRFRFVTPARLIDTRDSRPFTTLAAGQARSIRLEPPHPAAALVQNVTVAPAATNGVLSTFPGTRPVPGVSTINWIALGTPPRRAVLAITGIGDDERVGYQPLVSGTDLVVDAIGLFTR